MKLKSVSVKEPRHIIPTYIHEEFLKSDASSPTCTDAEGCFHQLLISSHWLLAFEVDDDSCTARTSAGQRDPSPAYVVCMLQILSTS